MGPKDPDRKEETNVRHEEEKEIKTGKSKLDSHFEKLKTEKFGKKEDMNDADMLEWIDLSRQLNIDRSTGKPYHVTPWDKTKAIFIDNPLVPIGNIL